jgi:ABC-type dipeptide/oligopeptide/nickel transport system permease component
MVLTLLMGSIVIFLLSKAVPQDAIDVKLANLNLSEENDNYQNEYAKYYIEENEHLPLFYISILPNHYYSNLHSFVHKKERNLLHELQDSSYDCSALTHLTNIDRSALTKITFHYPKIVFHGLQNQYHLYITDFLCGHMGLSKKDGKPIGQKINAALHWTLGILLINFILGVGLSWIIAFYLVKYNGHRIEKIFSGLTLILYAMPGFWLATLVLVFFTGHQYGMPFFYSPLFVDVDEHSFISVLTRGWPKIAPVVFCLTVLDIAYLTRMLKSNLLEQLEQPYTMALKSRGLSLTAIIKDHVYPNVMIPFVTLIVGSLPLALAGSLVFEIISNIPGVGRLLYDSIYGADWKVVYAIVLLVLIVTVVLYSVAEWAYIRLDPRI